MKTRVQPIVQGVAGVSRMKRQCGNILEPAPDFVEMALLLVPVVGGNCHLKCRLLLRQSRRSLKKCWRKREQLLKEALVASALVHEW